MMTKSKFVSLAALTLSVACAEASIGVDPCMEGGELCMKQPFSPAPVGQKMVEPIDATFEALEMKPLTNLELDWVKTLPTPGGYRSDDGGNSPILDSDLNGNLLYYYLQQNTHTLYVIPLDDQGQSIENIAVSGPPAWDRYASPAWGACTQLVCVDERQPTLKVTWTGNCGPNDLEACSKHEKLYFGEDLHVDPTRKEADVMLAAAGEQYVVKSDRAPSVAKLDASSGRALWSHSEFVKGTPFDKPGLEQRVVGEPLDDGRFVVAAQPLDPQLTSASGAFVMFSFIEADGTLSQVSQVFEAARGFLLNAKDHAVFVALVQGDLHVVRLRDAQYMRGVSFIRDDYTFLYPEATAIDPSGNVYVGTRSGSRTDPKPTLCKVPVAGGGSCYTLPNLTSGEPAEPLSFSQIVAHDGGELFIHSGSKLVRVTYPE